MLVSIGIIKNQTKFNEIVLIKEIKKLICDKKAFLCIN